MKSELPVKMLTAVVLLDHLHFMWQLPDNDWDYSKRVGQMKVLFSKSMGDIGYEAGYLSSSRIKHREKDIWQQRFWEGTVRDENGISGCGQCPPYMRYFTFSTIRIFDLG